MGAEVTIYGPKYTKDKKNIEEKNNEE